MYPSDTFGSSSLYLEIINLEKPIGSTFAEVKEFIIIMLKWKEST